jgi:alkanesulfonate monooxygenase SsuD/methylene tetrahydromethanopterin reductase-like flavin-dependent oxidoreductase (luciferase family)
VDFGICIATDISDVGIVKYAENLGYRDAWVPDSQMIWSDCYAYLALAAQQTTKIRLGTGVAVTGTRIAPVTAHCIATINRLAPGRTFLGIGTGNTAQRLMGHRPVKYAAYAQYIRIVRALLDGDEVNYEQDGKEFPVRFDRSVSGCINVEDHIPIHVSGFYARTHRLAGQFGDGLVCSIPPHRDFVTRTLANVRRGADEADRKLPDSFRVSSLSAAAVLEPGEAVDSERVIDELGPFAISSVHYVYDKIKENGGEPPPQMRPFWRAYCALVEQTPTRERHMRVHAGHCTVVLPEERPFVTPDLLRATCLVGTAAELVEQLQVLGDAGLDQLFLLPSPATQYRNFEKFSREVMTRL